MTLSSEFYPSASDHKSLLGQEFNWPEAKSEKFRPIATALFQGIRVFTSRAQKLNFRQLHGAVMGHEVLHTNLECVWDRMVSS